jgi:hypothetical protein
MLVFENFRVASQQVGEGRETSRIYERIKVVLVYKHGPAALHKLAFVVRADDKRASGEELHQRRLA